MIFKRTETSELIISLDTSDATEIDKSIQKKNFKGN